MLRGVLPCLFITASCMGARFYGANYRTGGDVRRLFEAALRAPCSQTRIRAGQYGTACRVLVAYAPAPPLVHGGSAPRTEIGIHLDKERRYRKLVKKGRPVDLHERAFGSSDWNLLGPESELWNSKFQFYSESCLSGSQKVPILTKVWIRNPNFKDRF